MNRKLKYYHKNKEEINKRRREVYRVKNPQVSSESLAKAKTIEKLRDLIASSENNKPMSSENGMSSEKPQVPKIIARDPMSGRVNQPKIVDRGDGSSVLYDCDYIN